MRGRAAGATEKPPGTGRFPLFVMAVVVLGAISLSLGLFKEFGSVLAPTFLAVNLVITAYPAYRWLEKHRVPRPDHRGDPRAGLDSGYECHRVGRYLHGELAHLVRPPVH